MYPSWTRHATVERLAQDWVDGVDHGGRWPIQVLSAKWRAATAPMRVVELACEVVGGGSFRRGHELERLSRTRRPLPPGHRCLRPRSHRQGTVGRRPVRTPLVTGALRRPARTKSPAVEAWS